MEFHFPPSPEEPLRGNVWMDKDILVTIMKCTDFHILVKASMYVCSLTNIYQVSIHLFQRRIITHILKLLLHRSLFLRLSPKILISKLVTFLSLPSLFLFFSFQQIVSCTCRAAPEREREKMKVKERSSFQRYKVIIQKNFMKYLTQNGVFIFTFPSHSHT